MIDAATPLSHQGLASGILTGKLTFPCSSLMRNACNYTPSLSTAESTRHDIDTRSANDNAQTKATSLRSKQSQFALHSPLAPHLVPRSQPRIEARNRRTFPLIERWSPRAVLTFVPGAEGRLWLRWMTAGNPTSFGVTTSVPAPLRRHRAASPLIGRPSPRPSHCPRAR